MADTEKNTQHKSMQNQRVRIVAGVMVEEVVKKVVVEEVVEELTK